MADGLNGRDGTLGREGTAVGHTSGAFRATLVNPVDPATPPPVLVLEPGPDGTASLDGAEHGADLALGAPPRGRLTLDGRPRDVIVIPLPDARRAASGVVRLEVVVDGWRFEVDVESDARARLRERATSAREDQGRGGPVELRAIIPGRVVSVDVASGDAVEAGGRLLVVEAMKMQNELRAPRAGTIGSVAVGPGQTVEVGDLLLVVE